MFDGMEAVVGGLEKSKELADPLPDDDHEKIIDAEFKSHKPQLIWGSDKESHSFHLFEDFKTTALCSRFFDANQLGTRKTELDDGYFKVCGGCLRVLHSRYRHG